MNVKVLRFISGEEVVSDVEFKEETREWFLKNPARLVPVRGNSGKEGQEVNLALVPLVPPYCEGKDMTIAEKAIVYIMNPNISLLNEYNKAYGSGLILPNTKLSVNKEQLLCG